MVAPALQPQLAAALKLVVSLFPPAAACLDADKRDAGPAPSVTGVGAKAAMGEQRGDLAACWMPWGYQR